MDSRGNPLAHAQVNIGDFMLSQSVREIASSPFAAWTIQFTVSKVGYSTKILPRRSTSYPKRLPR